MSTELATTGGSLAIRPDQTQWTEQQAAVLRQSGISDDVTAAELAGFLHLCQRTGLDPFSRQIYLIGRKDKKAGRVVYTPQTGIDGYRVVARRATLKSSGTYGYEDTLWCDASGRWRDVWLPDAPPAAAKVTVLRDGQKYSAVALYREYVQTGWENKPIGMWGKMPASQLAKCAEALALRKAFPHDLAGVYTAEEMAQADNPAPTRHLRSVEPGEADPWTTPAPQQVGQTAAQGRDYTHEAPEPHPPAQAIADAAAKATTRGEWRRNWSLGATGRLMGSPVKAPDTQKIEELGAYLTRRGTELPEEQQPATSDTANEQPVDAEIVPDSADPEESEHAAAVAELRAAAEAARLDTFKEGAHQALGCPVEDAAPSAIRALAAQIRGTAA